MFERKHEINQAHIQIVLVYLALFRIPVICFLCLTKKLMNNFYFDNRDISFNFENICYVCKE